MRQRTRTTRGAPLPWAAILHPSHETPRVAFTAVALLAAALCAPLSARSATLTWDASGTATTTATATDGSGTWNAATLRWNNGVSDLGWTNAADIAVIGNNNGAAGTLTLTAPLAVGGLIFNPAGSGTYLVTGSTLTLGGARTVTANANATIASTSNVGGAFIKDGAGTLTLTGGGTSGATAILNGRLVIGNTSRAPSYAISSGAALEVNTPGNINAGNVTFSGVGSLIKTGAGQLNWGVSAATFALGAGSLIDVQQGTFIGGSSANENWTSNLSDLRVATGATFRGVEANVRVNTLLGAGRIESGLNGAGYQAFTFGVNNGSGTFDGVLADSDAANRGNYIKTGTGTQTLTGVNTFTGYLLVQGGVLSVSAANQLGSTTTSNGLFIRSGAGLRYTGAGSESVTPRSINWDSGPANIDVTSPTGTLTSGIAGGTRNQAFTKQGAGRLVLEKTTAINDFTGSAVTIAGGILEYAQNNAGAITRFGGAVTGVAGTEIRVSGTGYIGNDNLTANWAANLASLDIGSGASFDLRGQGITVAGLTGSGTMTNSFANGVNNLTVGANNASSVFAGVIRQTAPTGFATTGAPITSLTKIGGGTQTLTGANTYSGGTSVTGGTLQVSADNNLGAATGGLTLNAGVLRTTASFASARAVTLGVGSGTFNTNANTTLQLNGVISGGTGSLVKAGTGQLTLAGANTYGIGTSITGGILQVSANNNLGVATSVVVFSNNATLRYGTGFASARPITLNGVGGTIDTNGNAAELGGVIGGAGRLTKTGAGELTLTSANTYAGGTTISAGTLQMGNGGNTGSIVGDVVNNGALRFNRADTIAFGGAVSGAGTLEQAGPGITSLTASNTYTGGTTVSAGTLAVNNVSGSGTGSGAVNVLSGARLAGSGTIAGSVNIANGGILAPGNSPGTLTTGALTLDAGSILNYEFGQAYTPGGALNDLTNVNGDLTLAGTFNVATSAGGSFLPGVYRVFNYTGALTNSTLNVGTAPVSAAGLAVQTSVANQVNLVNSTGVNLQYWDGGAAINHGPTGIEGNGVAEGGAGIWQGPPGNNNWTVASGVGDGPWAQGAFAVFQGTTGAVTVDSATQGPVNFQGAQFDADGYVVSGGPLNASTSTILLRVGAGGAGAGTTATINSVISDVGVVGGSQLVKTDPGTLVLGGVNTYAGGTAINGGVLQISADNNLGAAPGGLSFDGGTLRYGAGFDTARAVALNAGGGTFDANGNNATLTGVVSGTGLLTKSGVGSLTLANANTYGGGTALNTGTLVLNNSTAAGSGAIGMAGGTTLSAGVAGLTVANDVTTTGAAQINGGAGAFSLGGTIGGAGSITSTGTGVTTFTGTNTYTGGTTITAGTLQLGNGGTTGSIVGDVVDNATLLVNRSDVSALAGNISGTGNVQKLGAGTLTLTGTNSYGGGTALLKGRIDVGSNSALGTGSLAMSDGTTLGFTADGLNIANPVFLTGTFDPIVDTGAFTETLSGAITGAGILTKNGSGTLIVSGANTYTGATNVAQGTMRGAAANTFSSASAHVVAAGATLDTGGFNQRVASLSNSGAVSLLGTTPGSTLTINGAYVGNGGLLRLGTTLGDSGSVSDRLVLDGAGASATGNTTVRVTNLGGLGALTAGNGINLISALNGATTTAQTTKNAFALAGTHVDAGAYEYRLFAGDATGAGENWYLRSTSTVPVVPVTPVDPTSPTTPGAPIVPTVTLPTYRAEVPMYAALPEVLRQSDLAMLSNLHRRVGDEGQPIDAAAGWGGANRRVWARAIGGTTTVAQGGTTAPESRISMAGLQAGVDMFANDTWNAGVYAGQLRSDARVKGVYGLNLFTVAYAGSLRADNMYLGSYATYANPHGQYADFVLQYGRHDITGTAAGRSAIDNDATSITASAELGQRFALGTNWGIEPQVQLIYNRQSMERAQISGANVDQDPVRALTGRVGVRVTGNFMTGMGRLQPYARLNLWHGFRGTDRTSFVGPAGTAAIENGIGYTSAEVAAGFTLAMTQSTNVYGEAGKLFHTGGGQAQVKSSVQGALGVRVRF